MPMKAAWLDIDGDRLAHALQEVLDNLEALDDEVLLDFSSVRRIDPTAVRALESLATAAEDKRGKVILRGVNVEVYKVLKLIKLAPRFSFLT